jgi:hypothetical protein
LINRKLPLRSALVKSISGQSEVPLLARNAFKDSPTGGSKYSFVKTEAAIKKKQIFVDDNENPDGHEATEILLHRAGLLIL